MEMGTKSVPFVQTIATIVFLGCYMISNLPKESKFDPTSHTLSVQAVKRVLEQQTHINSMKCMIRVLKDSAFCSGHGSGGVDTHPEIDNQLTQQNVTFRNKIADPPLFFHAAASSGILSYSHFYYSFEIKSL